ncbi:hypothetical protein MTR67_009766 [Solanum verrucosum]|uniref:Uncharacterized protein n=1 Tax=Solanum verrucosum TaxID=315347 RepID=A0AAF0Q3Y1_SOLVR|nr:hypothetical protein MTR67_009766 [Solanum verrucosum]
MSELCPLRVGQLAGNPLIFGSFCPILKEKELGAYYLDAFSSYPLRTWLPSVYRVLESEEEKKKRRRRGEREDQAKIRQDHRGFSSGVIPIKLCESLVWVDPFPHTPNSSLLRKIGYVVEVVGLCC